MSTLARLSLWVPPVRAGDVQGECDRSLVPVLRRHGLEPSAEAPRAPVEGVSSRLFEAVTPAALAQACRALRRDADWRAGLQAVRAAGADPEPGAAARHRLGLYRTTAGLGRTTEVGRGARLGLWQRFGPGDGLPVATVTGLLRDRHDGLWLTTDGMGACRYDGSTATAYTVQDGLPADAVHCVAEDATGGLWFGTGFMTPGAGLCRYDGQTFEVFATDDGLADNTVSCLLVDRQGALWAGTGGYIHGRGLCRFDGRGFTTFGREHGFGAALGGHDPWCLLEDGSGRVWVGTVGGGVRRFDGTGFETWTTADGLAHNTVFALLEDRAGKMWMGTGGGGVSRYSGERFESFSTQDGLLHPRVLSLLEDRAGDVWLGTYGGGLSRYDGSRFTGYTVQNGLSNNQVLRLLEDSIGSIWAGTWSGVDRYERAQGLHLSRAEGLADDGVFTVLEDCRGDLWCGTFTGASRYHGGRLSAVEVPGPPLGVPSIAEDSRGRVWLALAAHGAVRFDHGRADLSTGDLGLGERGVRVVLEDSRQRLWFALTDGGLVLVEAGRAVELTAADGLGSVPLNCLLEDRRGRLWAGSRGGGLCRWEGERFVRLGEDDGLPSDLITCLAEDRAGGLWVGTAGQGAARYDGERFRGYTSADGLAHDTVLSILEDRRGVMWFGTYGGGVSCFDGQVFQTLTRETGLSSDAVQRVIEGRNGDLWIATEGGVTRYRPQRVPPQVEVTEVLADRAYGTVAEVRVPESQRLVVFAFRGRSWTTHPDRMVYRYRLRGHQEDWRVAAGRRAEYLQLPVGEYVFEVEAVDRDLNYSAAAQVRVAVVPDPRVEALSQALAGPEEGFVGSSAPVRRLLRQLEQVAGTDLSLLILGETGTGKGLAARLVHRLSGRAHRPLIQVSCGALPEGLVESELFGHEKGAFTGAVARQLGKVEIAEGGTLFLDEIGDLSAAAQAKLLQVLEEGTYMRVGGARTLRAQVRVIAATNRDLRKMVGAGAFREDLYYRLQEFQVELPPLRVRGEDIAALASYFAVRMAGHLGKTVTRLAPAALAALQAYPWPGNVRELEHVVRRAVVVCAGQTISVEDLFLGGSGPGPAVLEPPATLEQVERRHIEDTLAWTGGVIKGARGAARILGLPPSSLYAKMAKLGIGRPGTAG